MIDALPEDVHPKIIPPVQSDIDVQIFNLKIQIQCGVAAYDTIKSSK